MWPGQVDEWSLWMTSEKRLAPSTNRGYQGNLRLFSEFLTDARYGWVAECEQRFGPGVHPVPICHEWNTIAHLNSYEGRPEARPFHGRSCSGSSTTPTIKSSARSARNAKERWQPIVTLPCSRSSMAGACSPGFSPCASVIL